VIAMAAATDAYTRTLQTLRDLSIAINLDQFTGPVDEVRDSTAMRRASLWLSQALNNDHAYMEHVFDKAYPNDASKLPRRYFNLVARIAHELATLYAHRVVRKFDGPGAMGAGGVSAWVAKMRGVYEQIGMDAILHDMERSLKIQRYQLGVVLPAPRGLVEVMTCDPWEVAVTPGRPSMATDIQQAAEIRIRYPLEATDQKVRHGWLVFRPGMAWIEDGEVKTGVYRQDMTSPLPFYPVATGYASKPRRGWHLPSVSQDLLSMQIMVNLSASDQEHGLKYSWPQKFIDPGDQGGDPQEMANDMPQGVDKIPAVQTPGGKMGIIQPQPPIPAFQSLFTSNMKTLAILWDMSPDSFMKEATAKTAVSRAFDRADREEARARASGTFAAIETQLARAVAATLNLDALVKVPENVSVRVEYAHFESPADPFHAAQARALAVRMGESTAARFVAERDGISLAAARQRVRENLQESAGVAGLQAQVLDVARGGGSQV